MKKALYLITGFSWGIFFSNHDIIFYSIFLTILTILIEIFTTDSE